MTYFCRWSRFLDFGCNLKFRNLARNYFFINFKNVIFFICSDLHFEIFFDLCANYFGAYSLDIQFIFNGAILISLITSCNNHKLNIRSNVITYLSDQTLSLTLQYLVDIIFAQFFKDYP